MRSCQAFNNSEQVVVFCLMGMGFSRQALMYAASTFAYLANDLYDLLALTGSPLASSPPP